MEDEVALSLWRQRDVSYRFEEFIAGTEREFSTKEGFVEEMRLNFRPCFVVRRGNEEDSKLAEYVSKNLPDAIGPFYDSSSPLLALGIDVSISGESNIRRYVELVKKYAQTYGFLSAA